MSRITFTRPAHPDLSDITRTFAGIRPYGGASLIYADPPWKHEDYSDAGDKRKTAGHHYRTRPLSWVEQLPVSVLAADNCLLFIWVTAPLLRAAFGVIDSWGFDYKSAGTWTKRGTKGGVMVGTGRRVRTSNEMFLIATRGKPKVATAIRSVIVTGASDDPWENLGITVEAIRREHSRKPDEGAEAARMCVDGPAVELFGRESRPGWTVWGNENTKFDSEERS